ncbi:MAG: DUF58 domain-containing protein [Alphaproteobacteria bacterium]|nr:DUF58 domain-containing protein [Alphaproteobacteria bacterium]
MTTTPTAEDIHHRAEELGAGLPPLLVAAERVAATVSQGVHGRRRVGQGETFWQFRRYQSSDSAQQIDWRQSAKSQRVYVRETEWEAAQSVWLWRDETASMDFRSSPELPTKSDRAALLALALAALLIRGGEHVALSGHNRPPSTGRAALLEMAAMLSRQIDASADPSGMPPIEPMPRDARIILFSDFLDPIEDIRSGLESITAKGVRGHMVRIIDPAEDGLPYTGRILFQGCESDGEVLLDGVEDIRHDYAAVWRAHGEALDDVARSAGWGHITHHTNRPAEEALLQLYLLLSNQDGA